jgi:hypothetical protein
VRQYQKIIFRVTFISILLLAEIAIIQSMEVYGQSKEKMGSFQEFRRDPFLLPSGVHLLSKNESALGKVGTKPMDASSLVFKIKAILISDHIRLASIDQHIVTIGDSIYGEKVLEIKEDRVILGKGDQKRTIFLDQSPIKVTVEKQGEKR